MYKTTFYFLKRHCLILQLNELQQLLKNFETVNYINKFIFITSIKRLKFKIPLTNAFTNKHIK